MKALKKWIFLIACLLIPIITQAASYTDNLANIGISYQFQNQALNITFDKKKMLQSIRQFQKNGEIDSHLSMSEINFYKPIIPGSLSVDYTAKLLKYLYGRDATLDKLHVNVYLFSMNLYGHDQKNLCYSFDFNRKLYDSINWVNFNPENMASIFPNFSTSELCETVIEDKLLFSK